MEDEIHIGMALKNVQLHILIISTRKYLVSTQGQTVMKRRSQGQIKLNKQYQKTSRAGLLDEVSKLWQESGRSSREGKSNYLLRKTEMQPVPVGMGCALLLLSCIESLLRSSHKILRPINQILANGEILSVSSETNIRK